MIRLLFKGFLSLALLLLAAEQSPQLPKPTFSSSVTLVEVDVVAIDKSSGNPVDGLRAEDFGNHRRRSSSRDCDFLRRPRAVRGA